jgi:hypothetical protein
MNAHLWEDEDSHCFEECNAYDSKHVAYIDSVSNKQRDVREPCIPC